MSPLNLDLVFNTYREFANYISETCVICHEKDQVFLLDEMRNFCIEERIMYGNIESWDSYKLGILDKSNNLSEEEIMSYCNPILPRGAFYGLYLSRVLLPTGYLCPDCFRKLEGENKIFCLWSH